jgi:DNA anti-recombination protein RmuC
MFDIKKVQDEAAKEVAEERAKKAKESVKEKLRQIDKAKQIVSNLERELDDLYVQLSQGA